MKLIIKFLITAAGIYYLAKYAPQYTDMIQIDLDDSYKSAVIFAIILAIVNTFLGTIIRFITFPIRFLTLGIFNFVIIAFIAYITDYTYDGIYLHGVATYLAVGLIPSLVNIIFGK